MPNWTKEQKEAIEKEGTNIIVSAGAGSGKTAVLTERVLRKLKQGVNINNLLILTFTKAAAHEMKERIRKSISEHKELRDQLNLIDTAYITTFDSFALSVVKKYHYLLNVSPSISITDSNFIALEKEKILDNIFNELYEKEDPLFLKLINDLCIKDDNDIRKTIIDIDDKLNLKIDKEEFIKNYETNYYNDKTINNNINLYINYLKVQIKQIQLKLDDIELISDGKFYIKLKDSLDQLINSDNFDDIKANINIKLPQIPKNSDEELKKEKENLTKLIKKLKELCDYDSIDDIKEKILLSFDYITIILNIIKELNKRLDEFKSQNNLYEFADIVKMSIKVVTENKSVKQELTSSLNEIMIDEYQDTNDLQEYFISLISNNNVYMVGDIKQSIYRFRNANPNIFKEKYDSFSLNNGGIKIDLNKNFRSRKEVIDNINLIFENLMDNNIGGADYQKSHKMIFGQENYEINKPNQNYNLDIYYYDYEKNQKYTKEEIEYFFVANDIKKKISNNYQIYDKDLKTYRKAKYSDFVILVDRGTSFDIAKKIFEYNQIPLAIYRDENITNAYDQIVIKNIILLSIKELKQEYDEEYKYLFMSLARSFIFEYSDEIIFKHIKDNTYKDDYIIKKIKNVIANIQNESLTTFLNKIIVEFNLFDNFIKLGNINESMIRLEYLHTMCLTLENLGYTIYELGDYLKQINEKKYELKISADKVESNSVKIMTIHKSKGLEYSICYFTSLYKEFNLSDMKEKFIYSDKYGILAPYYKNGIGKNIYFELLKYDYLLDEISERIRLFYVALTRAKEKVIMVLNSPLKSKEFNLDERINYRKMSDAIYALSEYLDKYISYVNLDELNLSKDYNLVKKNNYKENIEYSPKKILFKKLNIPYEEINHNRFSKEINEIINQDKDKSRNLGLKFHEILEYLDLKNPNLNLIDNEFLRKKIKSFLNNEILSNINDSVIYKESEFKFTDEQIQYHGIIDLILEYEDHIDIIDYKLKNITDENYKKQLNGYKNYIFKIKNKNINLYLYSILDEKIYKI